MVLTQMKRSQSSLQEKHSFPFFQLFLLAICRLAEPIALTSIFPIAFPMVKGFKQFDDKNVAIYAGILLSSFALAEALTGCHWGAVSDRVGRKPVLLLGCFGTMLSMLMVGFASNYWTALFARCLGGLLNGNVGIIQTMVGELIKNPEHEPRAYAVMPFVWSIGTIFGPAIAGLTAYSPLFPTRPFLMPNLICAGLLFVSIVMGYFCLEETRDPSLWEEKDDLDRDETASLLAVSGATNNAISDLCSDSYGTFNRVETRESRPPVPEAKLERRSSSQSSISSVSSFDRERVYSRRVVALIVCLGIYCYHAMAYEHLMPIFAQDDRPPSVSEVNSFSEVLTGGGLGLSTHQFGLIMAVNGFVSLFIQGILFPLLAGWLGIWRLFQIVMVLFPTAYFIVPFIATAPQSSVVALIYACMTWRNIFSILLYPIILILLKEACSPKHLGKINGLAASVGAAARCVAPPVTGYLYSVGVETQFGALAWIGIGAIAVAGTAQSFWIKPLKNQNTTVYAAGAYEDEVESA